MSSSQAKRGEKQAEPEDPNAIVAECSICLQTIVEKVTATDCGHSFCWPCISRWMHVHRTCPLCRQRIRDIRSTDHHQIAVSVPVEFIGYNLEDFDHSDYNDIFTLSPEFLAVMERMRLTGRQPRPYSSPPIYMGQSRVSTSRRVRRRRRRRGRRAGRDAWIVGMKILHVSEGCSMK